MRSFKKVLAFWFLLGAASLPVVAQKSGGCLSISPPLGNTDVCFRIDTADPLTQGLRQPNVVSGDRVYIQLVRKPVEKCSVQLKTEVIQPPPSGFQTFLQTVKIASALTEKDECQDAADKDPNKPKKPDGTPADKPAEVNTFELQGQVLNLLIKNLNAQIKKQFDEYADEAKALIAFQNCRDRKGTDICSDKGLFETTQAGIVASIDKLLVDPMPQATLVDFQVTNLKTSLNVIPQIIEVEQAKTKEKIKVINPWYSNKANQFACYEAEVAGIKAHLSDVAAERKQFATIVDVLRGLDWPRPAGNDWPIAKLKLIPPQKNAKVTATVSCTNVISGDATIDPVSVIVSYRDIPRTSSTVGVLLTLTPKQVIGSTAVKTGQSGGVPTFKNVFAVTSSAPVQVIPFTFLNVRLHYWRFRSNIFTLNAAGGVGVNPNSGTNQVEYFAGTSFGIGNLYIDFGAHIGEFQNLGGGFLLGETVPSTLTKIPIKTKYTAHPSFGFTYRLPLP